MTYALNFLVILECEFFYNRTQFHYIENGLLGRNAFIRMDIT
jgi:hypothetical protein